MKIVLRLFFPLLCMLPIVATAQTNSYMNNPMVRVTMETYAAMLRENPQDYTIYYSRGKDYYQYGDYEKALTEYHKLLDHKSRILKDWREYPTLADTLPEDDAGLIRLLCSGQYRLL